MEGEDNTDLVEFFRLLLKIDQKINPDNYKTEDESKE